MYIERWVEGDRPQRMKLDQGQMNSEYWLKKLLKHGIWIAIALVTGFSFVAYFVPARTLADSVIHAHVFGWSLFWILFYGFATYGNAGFMREQVCKYMCPYARFQSAMFDQDTLIVTYNPQRGENRGHRSKNANIIDIKAQGLGDCVDCNLCVQVCPTGIDIRDGLQYECIGCGACADVCDQVMDKMHYEPKLISFSTERAQREGVQSVNILAHILRPRVLIYAFLLMTLSGVMFYNLLTQAPFKLDIVRDRSAMSRLSEDSEHHMILENVYRIQIMNATEHDETYLLSVKGLEHIELQTPSALTVKAAQSEWFPLRVSVPAELEDVGSHKIFLTIKPSTSTHALSEATMFLVPSH
jgi:cytochrome c oxidase accessory protein FixG